MCADEPETDELASDDDSMFDYYYYQEYLDE